jgi:thiamine pyrophosphate-dependent acetolactate synthase large subunit-like protein
MSLLHRREAVRELLRERGELIVVAGLGAPAYDLASCGNQPLDFPLWGAMGGAAMVGLGLALAQPERKVLVLTGDGELLMGLGSLATIAAQRPANLRIVVLDNERYGETGQQRTHRDGRRSRGDRQRLRHKEHAHRAGERRTRRAPPRPAHV